ncbi:MAG: thioredoxin domain-containing protein [Anaerolineae bacterium]|nr:thioredoxin domain-containing protein [Anaerolineae bacterium]
MHSFKHAFAGFALALVAVLVAACSTSRPNPSEPFAPSGKPMFIEFYAPWCGSCQSMKPVIAKLREEYGARVEFVSYNIDDPSSEAAKVKYRFLGQPQYVLVNANGDVVITRNGVFPYERLRADIETLLQ